MLEFYETNCLSCGKSSTVSDWGEWGLVFKTSDKTAEFVCPACIRTKNFEYPLIDVASINIVHDTGAPLRGNYLPAKTSDQVKHFRSYPNGEGDWHEIELPIVDFLEPNRPHLIELNFHNAQWKELWVRFEWVGNALVALSLPGDLSGKNQWLTIYQRSRLLNMGFEESGRLNKTWTLKLSDPERDPVNVARIISNTLQFGLFYRLHMTSSVTPTFEQ